MTEALAQEIRALSALLGSDRDPDGRAFVSLADAYHRAGNPRRAVQLLVEGLGRHPESVSGHVVAARIYADRGLFQEAEISARRVLELDAGNVAGLATMVRVLEASGRPSDALRYRERLAELEPEELPSASAVRVQAILPGEPEEDVFDLALLAPERGGGLAAPDAEGRAGAEVGESESFLDLSGPTPPPALVGFAGSSLPALEPDLEEPLLEVAALAPAADEAVWDLAALAPEPEGDEPILDLAALAPDVAEPFLDVAALAPDAEEPVWDLAALAPEPEVDEPVLDLAALGPQVGGGGEPVELGRAAEAPPLDLAALAPDGPILDLWELAPDDEPVLRPAPGVAAAGGRSADIGEVHHADEFVVEEPVLDLELLAPGVDPHNAVVGAAPVLTRTLAELYVRQGLVERAIDVYRQLLDRDTADAGVGARLRELEQMARPGMGAPMEDSDRLARELAENREVPPEIDTPFAWAEDAFAENGVEAGPTIGAYFDRLLGWEPGGER